MGEKPPPDFAMLRAVEILASMHERARTSENVPPPPLDRPVILQSERIALQVGTTQRADVERNLGVAFSYPARGWHTYATKERGVRCLLSLFYKSGALVAAELYVPRSDRAPALAPRDFGGMRLEPGGVHIGMPVSAIPSTYSDAAGGPGPVVFDRAFEARFEGGVAFAMLRKGTVERIALYADARTSLP